MEKKVPIKTDAKKFYRQYLELMNPFLKLRGKELDVLAQLLYFNNKLKDIEEKHRWVIIFDYDNKQVIREELDLSEASLNNNLSALRKKGVIKNNKVMKSLLVYPEQESKLTFKFIIADESNS